MGCRIAFYGDDFTGSTDVMEVLQWAGVPTILFLAPPTELQLEKFDRFEAIGVAGASRGMSPAEMQLELTPILQKLGDTGASLVHYKTCSTFDSSPEIGSIGKAIEIGREVFGPQLVPVVIGAPNLGRYQIFGNLFARSGLDSEPFRLDRHPTMMHHPITPMHESDLRVHLSRQTQLRLGLYDLLQLAAGEPWESVASQAERADVLFFDVLLPEQLAQIGGILEQIAADQAPSYMVGSSGIEYALTSFWDSQPAAYPGRRKPPQLPTFDAVEQLLVITGSCSPVNDRQIAWAEQHGFETLPLDTSRLIDPHTSQAELESTITRGLERLDRGASLIMFTSRGPRDPRIKATLDTMQAMGLSQLEMRLQSGKLLGPKLGKILGGILADRPLPRIGIAGGDTSGFIARELGLTAFEAIAPVAPGSPLCRAYAENALDGVELILKGGQVGKDDLWSTMIQGTRNG